MNFAPVRTVRNFFHDLRNAPEAQYITSAAAPTQFPSQESLTAPGKVVFLGSSKSLSRNLSIESDVEKIQAQEAPHPPGRTTKKKLNLLDAVVKAAGSRWTLGFVLLLLVVWGVLGAIFGPTDTWQVILQDVSSIQAYTSATLLMRQQKNNTRSLIGRICGLISRSESNERMVGSLTMEQRANLRTSTHRMRAEVIDSLHQKEDLIDKAANGVAKATGSLISSAIYWAGIIVWVAWGVPLHFSDTWQLYVNTATALEITFVTVFLQNIRSQHDKHLEKTVQGIEQLDTEIEMQLRLMTGDVTPNPTVTSQPAKLTKWEKGIDVYAFIIGGSIGIVISAVVFAVWLVVGDPMDFDDNWFLIIGTYTGLIGFIDGFILKNVDARETKMANMHFEKLVSQDSKIFSLIGIELPASTVPLKTSLNMRISKTIGKWVESTCASYAAVGTVAALIVVASAMRWTETGQLLCNTPTMIVEGFLLITLLQAHNMADHKRRMTYEDILNRRLVLDKHLAVGRKSSVSDDSTLGEKDEFVIHTDHINM
ncbi:hypothetical protein VSDG_09934 [Cytospora chrysosperma]|uniref:Low affinity iron permease n=1 Tax=Cytospora chrysosperma TaxID=252740 RepID=A0A423V8P2_CYTCH|nr:hypothetical protein VSDG_09934 [Valsa sordida]